HPPPSHPFPTRRSSDLRRVPYRAFRPAPQIGRTRLRTVRAGRTSSTNVSLQSSSVDLGADVFHQLRVFRVFAADLGGEFVGRGEDRKSTRLNSSHVSIS